MLFPNIFDLIQSLFLMSIQNKKRVLIIANELSPYLEITDFSRILNQLAVKSFEAGMEVRVIMPRFGVINERRHRLHEVVRLSGINVVVDKEDHPLLIKVASLPNARLQVYFMDNEDFFKRKFVFRNAEEEMFDDNEERMIFFNKSALEIVKKFGWPPDIIHCHGWFTSLVPMFLKTAYKKEPVFAHSKILVTSQQPQYKEKMKAGFDKMVLGSVPVKAADMEPYGSFNNAGFSYGAAKNADVIIYGDNKVDKNIVNDFKPSRYKKIIPYSDAWNEDASSLFETYLSLTKDKE